MSLLRKRIGSCTNQGNASKEILRKMPHKRMLESRLSELAKTFEDIFPMPCIWCGRALGSHLVKDESHIYGNSMTNCAAEIKKLLKDSERLAVWMIDHSAPPNDFRQPVRSAIPNAD